MLIIELNEFNPDFLKRVSKELNLENIETIFNLKHTNTFTDETVEFQGLDPWVQWVSIHTGKPFKEHGICRLSETKKQNFDQIWNLLGKKGGYSCGIWGVINAPCGDRHGIKFFVPDPWSFDELAMPNNLNNFLSLPRYMAKNYLSPNLFKFIEESYKMINFLIKNRGKGKTRRFFSMLVKSFFISGINLHTFYSLLDFLSTLYFIEFKEKLNTNFNILFLNHIAHIQHQFWDLPDKRINKHMKLSLIICNEILGMLIKSMKKNEQLMIINGIRQKLVKGNGFFIYRQRNPINFFKSFGIKAISTEQNMTNDGILIFNNTKNRDSAIKIIEKIYLKSNKKKIFFIEAIDDKKVFFQLNIKNKVEIDEKIIFEDRSFKFFDLIEYICQRTGAHTQQGDIYYKGFTLPAKIYNHEIYGLLSNYLISK